MHEGIFSLSESGQCFMRKTLTIQSLFIHLPILQSSLSQNNFNEVGHQERLHVKKIFICMFTVSYKNWTVDNPLLKR